MPQKSHWGMRGWEIENVKTGCEKDSNQDGNMNKENKAVIKKENYNEGPRT